MPYMVLVMLPFWTSILVKSFAFGIVLGDNGIVNQLPGSSPPAPRSSS